LYSSQAYIVTLRHTLLSIAQLYPQPVELPNLETNLLALLGIQFGWPPARRGRQAFRGILQGAPQEKGNGPYQAEHGFHFFGTGIWSGNEKGSELLAVAGMIPNLLKKRNILLPPLDQSSSSWHRLVQV
jgi:hypothetical protein